jgi:hypothetical protein
LKFTHLLGGVEHDATASETSIRPPSGPAKVNRLRMIPPLVVSVVGSDGCGKSAKITVEAETMQ